MKKRLLLVLSLFVILVTDIQGQTTRGAYGFLDANNSARVAALGGIISPIYDSTDIQLGIYNPSIINRCMHNSMALSYVNFYDGSNFATAQYARDFGDFGTFVGTVQFDSYGVMDYADESGNLTGGTFSASDYLFTIGWGRQLTPHWSIGANLKLGGIQYESYHTFMVAVDVAGHYRSTSGWMFSLGARNAGVELYNNLPGDKNGLPFHLSLGAAKKLDHVPFLFSITYDNIQKWDMTYNDPLDLEGNYDPMTGDYKTKSGMDKFADNLMRHVVFGGEFYVGKNVVLRLGFNYGSRQNLKTPTKKGLCGFSYGVGVNIWKFTINYSRSEMHIYGSPNYITITTNIDRFLKGVK